MYLNLTGAIRQNGAKPREGTVVQQVTLTPQVALDWLNTKRFERQRNIKPRQVDVFAAAISVGEFRHDSVIALAGPNGDDVVVDGYHRLHAIVKADEAVVVAVSMTVCRAEEIERLYALYDGDGTVRRAHDIIRARFHEGDMLPHDQLMVVAAYRVIRAGFKQVSRDPNFTIPRANALHDEAKAWWPEMYAMKQSIEGCVKNMYKHLTRASTLSIALVTFRHQPERAAEFWHGAALADGLELTDPRRRLYDWLNAIYLRSYTARKGDRITDEGAYRYVAKAWNAHMAGQKMVLLKVTEKDMHQPVTIHGTPFGADQPD